MPFFLGNCVIVLICAFNVACILDVGFILAFDGVCILEVFFILAFDGAFWGRKALNIF